jgi:NAD(P)-dependent dehydrogenase (short-subunit alcohol dehydrogenase family)
MLAMLEMIALFSMFLLISGVSAFRTIHFLHKVSFSRVRSLYASSSKGYSIANQKQRNALAKAENKIRVLDIDSIYDPSYVKGKNVLVTGGNRGIGLAISKELQAQGANVFITTRKAANIPNAVEIEGIDVTDDNCGTKLVEALNGVRIDILINNAGYFYEPVETLTTMNYQEELKMIDICAIGPLRVTSALYNAGVLSSGSRVVIISSQGGSISWRFIQNPNGHDYGHHMSKAAANMAGVLLAQELKAAQIAVKLLHPGFNKTDMTKKYEAIWEEEGAVDASLGAKRVVHEIGLMEMATTGSFVNCEDGLEIPW